MERNAFVFMFLKILSISSDDHMINMVIINNPRVIDSPTVNILNFKMNKKKHKYAEPFSYDLPYQDFIKSILRLPFETKST